MATKPVDKRAVKRFYDKWVAAGRDAQVITYSKQYGEVSRVRINSRMIDSCE